MNVATGASVNTTTAGGNPAWSPDGRRIAFASSRDGPPELYVMNPDGSDVVRVTTAVGFTGSRPSWSADSTRLAFGCEMDTGNADICVIRLDGTGFLRLTDDPASDGSPAWSPDGRTILFVTTRYGGGSQLALMNSDGSAVSLIGSGVTGFNPTWSSDGRQIAFDYPTEDDIGNVLPAIYTMKADGSNITLFSAWAQEAAWMPGALVAGFTSACNSLTCTFDGTSSLGDIVTYSWDFGDHTTATGSIVTHTFAAGGTYPIALTVTNAGDATATTPWTISVNRPPVASFTFSCDDALTCLFDWSGSYDPDGSPLSIALEFGDGGRWDVAPGSPTTVLHTYNRPANYTATLSVSDRVDVTMASRTVTVPTPVMHVGDLDASITNQQNLRTALVRIGVHTSKHGPLGNALLSASWNDGTTTSCSTDPSGYCVVARSYSPAKPVVSLTVTGVTRENYVYTPAANHDPDGDSNGTTISIKKQ